MLVLNKYACLFARKARQLRLNRATNLAKWFLGYCKQRRVYMVLRFFFKRVVRSQSVGAFSNPYLHPFAYLFPHFVFIF